MQAKDLEEGLFSVCGELACIVTAVGERCEADSVSSSLLTPRQAGQGRLQFVSCYNDSAPSPEMTAWDTG